MEYSQSLTTDSKFSAIYHPVVSIIKNSKNSDNGVEIKGSCFKGSREGGFKEGAFLQGALLERYSQRVVQENPKKHQNQNMFTLGKNYSDVTLFLRNTIQLYLSKRAPCKNAPSLKPPSLLPFKPLPLISTPLSEFFEFLIIDATGWQMALNFESVVSD